MEKELRPSSLPQALSLRRSTAAQPLMYDTAGCGAVDRPRLYLSGCEEFTRMDTDGKLLHIGAGVTAQQLCKEKCVPELLHATAELCPKEMRGSVSLGGALCRGNAPTVATLGALDAKITVASETGRRTMKLRRFLRNGQLSLARDELLCEILISDRKGGSYAVERCGEDMAFSGFLRWDHRRIVEFRLAFCGPEGELVRFEELEENLLSKTVKDARELRDPLLNAYDRYLPLWDAPRRATLLLQAGSFLRENNI